MIILKTRKTQDLVIIISRNSGNKDSHTLCCCGCVRLTMAALREGVLVRSANSRVPFRPPYLICSHCRCSECSRLFSASELWVLRSGLWALVSARRVISERARALCANFSTSILHIIFMESHHRPPSILFWVHTLGFIRVLRIP